MKVSKIFKKIISVFVFEFIRKYANIINCLRGNFKKFSVRTHSILIIECATFHGENFPSLTKYLLDLGYNVDVIFRKTKKTKEQGNRNDMGLLSCFDGDFRLRVKTLSGIDMNLLLRSVAATKYKHIIIVTFNNWIKQNYFYGIDFFKLKPICMIHNPDMIIDDYLKTNKVISPAKMDCIGRKAPYAVSIHYFGIFPSTRKSGTTTFVAFNTGDISRRNIYLLFLSCDELYRRGKNNFRIKIIGNGLAVPQRFHGNFQFFGFLNFQEMYKEIAESDFILALIDQASVKYTNKASGSYGLSYGFLKPIVLHRKFSSVSNFTDENSVLYDHNDDLPNAMEKCINMPDNAYTKLTSSLEVSERELYTSSLNNLKEALEVPIQYVSYDQFI